MLVTVLGCNGIQREEGIRGVVGEKWMLSGSAFILLKGEQMEESKVNKVDVIRFDVDTALFELNESAVVFLFFSVLRK